MLSVNWSVKIHCLVKVVIVEMHKSNMKAVEIEKYIVLLSHSAHTHI